MNYWPSTLDNVQTSPESKEAHTVSKDEVRGHRVKQVLLTAQCDHDTLALSPAEEPARAAALHVDGLHEIQCWHLLGLCVLKSDSAARLSFSLGLTVRPVLQG